MHDTRRTAAPPPPPSPRAPALVRPAPHPRGVFVEEDAPAGTVVLRVFDALGRRISRAELAADVFTAETRAAFAAWLDAVDPPAATRRRPALTLARS